ncbi:arsenate reductase/protein-tyrosine-phosphatase family protein [Streptomyces mirabilis]|uniref:arsenate reductase/protein-tyrosine-phosphatase family protein n=1 Tax=Streptomyces mirabilis TaxID=68239 RepID=UPI003322B1F6
MGWLTFGYFVSYIPYAMLVKALASGVTPLSTQPVNGFELMPAAVLGQLAAMILFLGLTGRWRHMRRSRIGHARIPVLGRETLVSGFFASLIIGSTTMNYTFSGVSILFMLLLMRGGVLVLSPLVDMSRKRRVTTSSWVALCLSLTAVSVALGDVHGYHLTLAAALSVLTYLVGYLGRFEIMIRVAKNGVVATDRRYFVEEHVAAPVCLALLLGAGALAGQPQLGAGFTTFLGTPAALAAAGIGVAYEVLFVFASLIYLDRREYTWGVPAWAFASLMSGLVASFSLAWLAGLQAPGTSQLIALAFGVGAAGALSYPSAAVWWRTRSTGAACRVLFVCGGNTSRSPMAEVIAWAQAAEAGVAHLFRFSSAGVATTEPASPMTPGARSALAELGLQRVPGRGNPRRHRSRPVTPELCQVSFVIYCMTRAHRDRVIAMAPEAEGRALCLDPRCDIPNPEGQPPDVYRRCTRHIQRSVHVRLCELLGGPEGAAALLSDEGDYG